MSNLVKLYRKPLAGEVAALTDEVLPDANKCLSEHWFDYPHEASKFAAKMRMENGLKAVTLYGLPKPE